MIEDKDAGFICPHCESGNNTGEDLWKIIISIRFHEGGFLGNNTDIYIRKINNGAIVKARKPINKEMLPIERQISIQRWQEIIAALFDQAFLHEWKERYVNDNILDGTQWELTLKMTNDREKLYYGSNDFPPCWDQLKKILSDCVDNRIV